MNSIKQWRRLIQIYAILAKHGLNSLLVSFSWLTPLRLLILCHPKEWFRKEQLPRGVALRQTLEELGPIFIKFGQALSTRPDLLPTDLYIELCKLQDQVPPCSVEYVIQTIESSLNKPITELFASFDETPLASASIAQVHAASLYDGSSVVVKVLRPNIHVLLKQDLAILKTLAKWIERYWHGSKRLKPKQVIYEFEQSLLKELDFQHEASSAAQLRCNFKDSPLLYVPEIYWDYVRDKVLVMERIHGIPVSNIPELLEYGVNLKKLAARGFEIFFLQVFRDGFFHADMHPGNIFVAKQHTLNPQYICIDFGIMGTLSTNDQRYLAENLLAFFNRDYRRVAELHVESGWVARDTQISAFQSAIRTVCEPIFEKPLKDLSFAVLVMRLFQVARQFHMEVQPQLILLQKTLMAVEGLGRQIDPDLDLWATAKPFFERFVKEQVGPKAFIRNFKNNLPFFIEHLPSMPRLLNDVLLLNKEQTRLMLENETAFKQTKRPRNLWGAGVSAGIFMALSGYSYVLYFLPVKRVDLAIMSISIGVCSGLLSILLRRR